MELRAVKTGIRVIANPVAQVDVPPTVGQAQVQRQMPVAKNEIVYGFFVKDFKAIAVEPFIFLALVDGITPTRVCAGGVAAAVGQPDAGVGVQAVE